MGNVLAFIPARGGSKGVKDKNIKSLNGKPLIAYTIESAKKSGIFKDIVVSTDSQKIADVAKKYGAYIPFLRPEELATDNAKSIDAITHCINTLKSKFNKEYDVVFVLQPTSPMRSDKDIIEAFKMFNEKDADSVISVCECEHSPLWCNTLNKEREMKSFIKEEVKNVNRQFLPDYYRVNGAIFCGKVDTILDKQNFYCDKSYAYVMDTNKSIDIDSELDFKIAQVLLEENT